MTTDDGLILSSALFTNFYCICVIQGTLQRENRMCIQVDKGDLLNDCLT